MNSAFQHPNPALQETYDTVISKLQTDEKYLDFAIRLLNLTPGQYRALYRFVKYMPDKNYVDDELYEEGDEDTKYAVKF